MLLPPGAETDQDLFDRTMSFAERTGIELEGVADLKLSLRPYCLCKQPYQQNIFMIACDSCDDWFHPSCIGLTKKEASALLTYQCPNCLAAVPANNPPLSLPPTSSSLPSSADVPENEHVDEPMASSGQNHSRKRTNEEIDNSSSEVVQTVKKGKFESSISL